MMAAHWPPLAPQRTAAGRNGGGPIVVPRHRSYLRSAGGNIASKSVRNLVAGPGPGAANPLRRPQHLASQDGVPERRARRSPPMTPPPRHPSSRFPMSVSAACKESLHASEPADPPEVDAKGAIRPKLASCGPNSAKSWPKGGIILLLLRRL